MALAFAPVHAVPILWLSFLGAFYCLNFAPTPKAAFWDGWWFGLGFFVASLYWIAIATFVDLASFWWVIPFALLGLPVILSFFVGPVFYLTIKFSKDNYSRILLFICFWVLFEWLRAHLFTGFPWNLLGYVWTVSTPFLQIAAFGGVYLLTFFTLLLIGITYIGLQGGLLEKRIMISTYVIAVFLGIAGLSKLQEVPMTSSGPWMRLVQPSIPQSLKWNPEQREANLYRLLTLSHETSAHIPQAIIWPETAVSFFLDHEPRLRRLISQIIPEGAYLITGAPRKTPEGHEPFQIWNSSLVLNHEGAVLGHYDKFHLVPFGEYVPWRKELSHYMDLSWMKKITAGAIDFSIGNGPETLHVEKIPAFGPLICYEAIFPGAVVTPSGPRPEWLLNVTNDAWYGNSSGPYQHLEIVRMRAVEEGLPLVRAANNGISAVFDAYGRQVVSIPLNEIGIRDFQLPPPIAPTLYARFGDLIIFSILAFFLGAAFLIRVGRTT
ncbi:Apolipoprotein N-acyltransferase [Candidatus Bealeia paramacronuclearis]|uniref:Apolipoprotein N-acyltransferase n=1 Tax=Candidatus Bealeia paramacronuclearis TaxID=1921001 RepID=A0ABZ2C4Y1_9PROT|nr:Apolipoprotein N-acyltransferase [Candidatus Bealeia paramacronuclearis]